MFEFVCDHLVPGCHHRDKDEKEEALNRAVAHLKGHHNLDYHDERMESSLKKTGIQFIRPV